MKQIAYKLKWFAMMFFISCFSSVAQKSISGVVSEKLSTKDGTVTIIRTETLPKGKTISGTVVAEPESDKENKRKKQSENLQNYVLKIGNTIIGNSGTFTLKLPNTGNIPLQVFSPEGKLLEEILLQLSDPVISGEFEMPKTIRKNYLEKITGSFSGDISEAKVLLNDTPTQLIAGNESELFFRAVENEPGKHRLTIEYGETKASETVILIDYSLRAGKLSLNKGESTYLDINVVGLEDIEEPLFLEVQNKTPGTVSLEGGDQQLIEILPVAVADNGSWQKRISIQSEKPGTFDVYTELFPAEPENDELPLTIFDGVSAKTEGQKVKPDSTKVNDPDIFGAGVAAKSTPEPKGSASETGSVTDGIKEGVEKIIPGKTEKSAGGAVAEGAKKVGTKTNQGKNGTTVGGLIKAGATAADGNYPKGESENPSVAAEKDCACSRAEIISIRILKDGNPFSGNILKPGNYRFLANVVADCTPGCELEIRGSWIIDFIPENGGSIIEDSRQGQEIDFRAEEKGRIRVRYSCRVFCDGKPCPIREPSILREYEVNPCKCEICRVVQPIRFYNHRTGNEIRGDSVEWGVQIRAELPEIRNFCSADCNPDIRMQMRSRIQYRNGGRQSSSWSNRFQLNDFQGPGVVHYDVVYQCFCDGRLCSTDTLTKSLFLNESNNCCDRLRNGLGELSFSLGNNGNVVVNNNRLRLFINGEIQTVYFDFNIESVFCNLRNNQIYSQLTTESISYSGSDDNEYLNTDDVNMGFSTDSEGVDPHYTMSFAKQVLIDGELKEISVSISIDSRTCEYDIQVLYNGRIYEKPGRPTYSANQLSTQIRLLGNPSSSYFWNRSLFLLGQIQKMQEYGIQNRWVFEQLKTTLKNAIARLKAEGKINGSNQADIQNLERALGNGNAEEIANNLVKAMNHFTG